MSKERSSERGSEAEPGSVNTLSGPSKLKITDMRFAEIVGAPMNCILMKIYTNQGIVGLGEVRDWSSRTFALMLKSRLLGENPCNVDRIFRRIKQFGGPSRQGGGVSGVEVALWDLAGKAYGVPAYQLLGGKFRDRVRMYCDTDVAGKHDGSAMGQALRKRKEMGFTFLKMDVGIHQVEGEPGTLSSPAGYLEEVRSRARAYRYEARVADDTARNNRNRWFDINNVAHPFTGVHITEKGLDALEAYVADARAEVGYEIPLAMDHFGHIGVEDCIKLARRLEAYAPAWVEDMIPWQLTDQWVRLSRATTVPACTGEDIYLKENFASLLRAGALAVVHPDVLTCGGMLEMKKISDLAAENGAAMAVHMAESPVACMAAAHSAAAAENFLALEYHSADVEWWDDIVTGTTKPLVKDGFITVTEKPGLGIDDYNDEIIREHVHPLRPDMWESTDRWDEEWSNDRVWS